MASSLDNVSMAVFCDFENVALGVRDANYDKFDIKPVLERLLLKGSIVVKKAYCDWDRYKGFKATMHEANFELIEIPHVRQSGKNSADIRLVVDALDLCYTKSHVNTFVIISGDSDFSPLVSKLRENAKQVIGVGVKQSTSDLLIANCDEFIFYDDLARESRRTEAKRDARQSQPVPKRAPDEGNRRKEEIDARKNQAIDMVVETFDALVSERGDSGKIWASMVKEAIKRRKPDFSESFYGFRSFGNLLEEAQARGLLECGRDEKSNSYVFRSSAAAAASDDGAPPAAKPTLTAPSSGSEFVALGHGARRNGRGGRGGRKDLTQADAPTFADANDMPESIPGWVDQDEAHSALAEPVEAMPAFDWTEALGVETLDGIAPLPESLNVTPVQGVTPDRPAVPGQSAADDVARAVHAARRGGRGARRGSARKDASDVGASNATLAAQDRHDADPLSSEAAPPVVGRDPVPVSPGQLDGKNRSRGDAHAVDILQSPGAVEAQPGMALTAPVPNPDGRPVKPAVRGSAGNGRKTGAKLTAAQDVDVVKAATVGVAAPPLDNTPAASTGKRKATARAGRVRSADSASE